MEKTDIIEIANLGYTEAFRYSVLALKGYWNPDGTMKGFSDPSFEFDIGYVISTAIADAEGESFDADIEHTVNSLQGDLERLEDTIYALGRARFYLQRGYTLEAVKECVEKDMVELSQDRRGWK